MPGLIELHTDNLEKYMNPRPGVDWPSESAVLAHDAQIVSAGITTVFHALAISQVNPKGNRLRQLPIMLRTIHQAQTQGPTRAGHRLPLRVCLRHKKKRDIFNQLLEHTMLHLV